MTYIKVGHIISTHGLKGEVKIKTDFKYPDLVYYKGFTLYIGASKIKVTINTIRSNYQLLSFDEYYDINDVIPFCHQLIYCDRSHLATNQDIILPTDLMDFKVITTNNRYIGMVSDYDSNGVQDILIIVSDKKRVLIPIVFDIIKNIDFDKHQIIINEIRGLIE